MKKRIFALAAMCCVAQAVAMPLTVPQIQTASAQTTRYDCKDGKSVSVQYTNTRNRQSFAALTVDGRKLLFVNVIAGSGAKYVADQYHVVDQGPASQSLRRNGREGLAAAARRLSGAQEIAASGSIVAVCAPRPAPCCRNDARGPAGATRRTVLQYAAFRH